MYLVRRAEEKICEHYPADEMKTPMHMSMGEEAIAVGMSSALKEEDQVFGTYRSHAIYLAKTDGIDDFFAELYGRSTSLLNGKCGSMHLCAPRRGFMGTSAIVASGIPVTVGLAFANKYVNNKKIAVVFFGDGAVDEGGFWESINLACLMKLPVIFVCEDNTLAVHTHFSQRRGYNSLARVISKFNCKVIESDSTDVEEIYNISKEAVALTRRENKPCFMNLKYYRYLEHVGINYDFDAGYRSEKEYEQWYKKDPLILQRNKLLKLNISDIEIRKIEKNINCKIEAAILKAMQAPSIRVEELFTEVIS